MAIGGVILFIGVLLMIFIFVELATGRKAEPAHYPIDDTTPTHATTPRFLERWGVWIGIVIFLIIVAYAVPTIDIIHTTSPGSKPFITW
jgi:cytochrome c oxidase subunit 1